MTERKKIRVTYRIKINIDGREVTRQRTILVLGPWDDPATQKRIRTSIANRNPGWQIVSWQPEKSDPNATIPTEPHVPIRRRRYSNKPKKKVFPFSAEVKGALVRAVQFARSGSHSDVKLEHVAKALVEAKQNRIAGGQQGKKKLF